MTLSYMLAVLSSVGQVSTSPTDYGYFVQVSGTRGETVIGWSRNLGTAVSKVLQRSIDRGLVKCLVTVVNSKA